MLPLNISPTDGPVKGTDPPPPVTGTDGPFILIVENRVFLNLWFAKPMVWVRFAFHEKDGNHENDENDEDNSDSYKQGVECWIRGNHGNHENDENHENPGCKPWVPQTTGLEIPEKMPLIPRTCKPWFPNRGSRLPAEQRLN